ncbi:MAG: sigma-70 family RNA polymerase sigma factor [Sphaerochaetaceae bacterium]|nr:sigma-70 family RNA polymerase sigma factor [Sphaerochaetaceae bacterium]
MQEMSACYSNTVSRYVSLSQEDQADLAFRISNGDTEARNLLVMHFQKYAIKQAGLFRRTHLYLELEDLIQSANIGLIKAAERYNASRGVSFETFAAYWIRQEFRKAVSDDRMIYLPEDRYVELCSIISCLSSKTNASVEEIAKESGLSEDRILTLLPYVIDTVSLSTPVLSEDEDTITLLEVVCAHDEDNLASIIASEDLGRLKEALKCLPARQAHILMAHFGAFGFKKQSLMEISREYGLSKERIRQIEKQAVEKLKSLLA